MSPEILFILLIVVIAAEFVLERVLELLNLSRMKTELPAELEGFYNAGEYARSQEYLRVKTRLSQLQSGVGFIAILLVLTTGVLPWLDSTVSAWTESPLFRALFFFGILGAAGGIMNLPFSAYLTFVIEERFGFNRTNIRTYVFDLLKSALLAAVIGGGILLLVVWIYEVTGSYFWLFVWGVLALFSILMTLLYSDLIVPLFNKQTRLEEGELREAILDYAGKVGFSIRDVYVIDGSKRSSKANAYFSGFGPRKRIVLYDTLIDEHSTEELVAILAHEAGHYKRGHIVKGMIFSLLNSAVMLFILSLFIGKGTGISSLLAQSLAAEPSFHIGVLVFGILYSPLSTLTGLLINAGSRKHEFQADAYAAGTYEGKHLGTALRRLSVKHLSNLQPHPLYVAFHYSHPPLLERLNAIETIGSESERESN